MPRTLRSTDSDYHKLRAAAYQTEAGVYVFWDNAYWLEVKDNADVYYIEIPPEQDLDKTTFGHKPKRGKNPWYRHYGPVVDTPE